MIRGEVFWGEHPGWGSRPAVVVTRDEAIGALSEGLVVGSAYSCTAQVVQSKVSGSCFRSFPQVSPLPSTGSYSGRI